MTYRQRVLAAYPNSDYCGGTVECRYYDARLLQFRRLILADPFRDDYYCSSYYAWKQAWKTVQEIMLEKFEDATK